MAGVGGNYWGLTFLEYTLKIRVIKFLTMSYLNSGSFLFAPNFHSSRRRMSVELRSNSFHSLTALSWHEL